MDYAKYHDGQTYTGIDWKFHNFGPWSTTVFNQIDVALKPFGAERRTFQSIYGDDDCIRWRMVFNEAAYLKLRKELPVAIKHAVPSYVETYKSDTTSLLHYVYATRPMLHAAPGEILDFNIMKEFQLEKGDEYVPHLARLSKKKKKKLKQGMDELRERLKKTVEERRVYYSVADDGQPDAVFEAGVAWLDGLAGKPFPESGATVEFTDEVWKSEARRGDG